MSRRDVWRVNDVGVVSDPRFVLRVGYPKSVDDYLRERAPAIRDAVNHLLMATTGSTWGETYGIPAHRVRRRIERDVAYLMAQRDGFGGRERTIHWRDLPSLAGREVRVVSLRTALTGRYEYGWTGQDPEDYLPAHIAQPVTHRLAAIVLTVDRFGDPSDLEIPVTHLSRRV